MPRSRSRSPRRNADPLASQRIAPPPPERTAAEVEAEALRRLIAERLVALQARLNEPEQR